MQLPPIDFEQSLKNLSMDSALFSGQGFDLRQQEFIRKSVKHGPFYTKIFEGSGGPSTERKSAQTKKMSRSWKSRAVEALMIVTNEMRGAVIDSPLAVP